MYFINLLFMVAAELGTLKPFASNKSHRSVEVINFANGIPSRAVIRAKRASKLVSFLTA